MMKSLDIGDYESPRRLVNDYLLSQSATFRELMDLKAEVRPENAAILPLRTQCASQNHK
jgi:hypothetical protein